MEYGKRTAIAVVVLVTAVTMLVNGCCHKAAVVNLGTLLELPSNPLSLHVQLSDTILDMASLRTYDSGYPGPPAAGEWNRGWKAAGNAATVSIRCVLYNACSRSLLVPGLESVSVSHGTSCDDVHLALLVEKGGHQWEPMTSFGVWVPEDCESVVFDTLAAGDSLVYLDNVDYLRMSPGLPSSKVHAGETYDVYCALYNPCWTDTVGYVRIWAGRIESNRVRVRIVGE